MKTRTGYLLALTSLVLCLVATAVATASPPDRRFAVTYARVVPTSSGPRLVVRVKGPARKVRIRIAMLRSNHVLRVASRWVATNHRVRVPRLTIPVRTTNVRIRVLGHIG